MRGVAWPTRELSVVEAVEDEYGLYAAVQVVSHAELFGGKVAAALDRQHPRDLFDIRQLYEHEGLSDEVVRGFLVALVSHSRPMHELIQPNLLDQKQTFIAQFEGMTQLPFTYDDFVAAREQLVTELPKRFSDKDRAFLLSFKQGEPDWNLAPATGVELLPAVQWKLQNLRRLRDNNVPKHVEQVTALEESLQLLR